MSAVLTPDAEAQFLTLPAPVELEGGETLPQVTVAYRTWGRLNPAGDNAVLVCHALTGSADLEQWWPGVLGADKALDPARDFIVCSNVLGGCYGSTGPTSIDPGTGRRYGARFPAVTVRDLVQVQAALLDELGVTELALVLGGSLGGMQALEWAALHPRRLRAAAAISVGARQSPWCIALSQAQRAAIQADARWRDGGYDPADPPAAGLAAARMAAMVSYRHWEEFDTRFGREPAPGGGFQVEGWLRHHGEKFVARFDANSYVTLTRVMDSHDIGRDRGGISRALSAIRVPLLVIGSTTDVLYTPDEQRELAWHVPGAELAWLESSHGHDAFLIDTERLDTLLSDFRRRRQPAARSQWSFHPCPA
ncbi:MAG TPA: homoserine O-acetyltransferase [Gammaproteobacteria bacterium]|nr:homoserine O-acetyltransferase [Gammaproteobacteria bacterium]